MDQLMGKFGSYWLGNKANKELNSVGDDINSLQSSISGGATWFVNKMKGKLTDVEGLKTKVMIWVKVTCITSEGSKVHFTTGLKKTRSRQAYEVCRDGITVDKF
ncbi:hypothetical protein E3N88_35517 [Mikania micrantha]|uniref:Uncharacterized protein n=1 Tax=Mikania micrantha TaxID=192012 RepID=A0A5N6M190_9ASTR|nr:hypothetical protein E3N88_35517 [Mikania micrantha]